MAGSTTKSTKRSLIPIAKPFVADEEVKAAEEVIRSGWLTQGPKVAAFEEAFAKFTQAKYACAVSSCTTAMHVALKTIGVKPGDIVITVSHSFIAGANAIRYCGAEPVFIDIDTETYNMSPEKLRDFLAGKCTNRGEELFFKDVKQLSQGESPLAHMKEERCGRVSAILVVHQMGLPCDLGGILSIAKEYQLPVIEDAACAVGSNISFDHGGSFEKVGFPHGDIACFSFHPRKVLTCGDGGMLTTNNEIYDKQFRLLRQHGMSISDEERHHSSKVMREEYITTAFNYRMTDIQAAIGIEQLKRCEAFVQQRRKLADYYKIQLKHISWLNCLDEGDYLQSNWQSFPVRILDEANVNREELMQYLLEEGISTRVGIMNAHEERPYQNTYWQLPESEGARDRCMLLPLFHTLKNEEIDFIVERFKNFKL